MSRPGDPEIARRFGFLISELARLYSRQFDQRARTQLGLSQAQCRLLHVLAAHDGSTPLSQVELSERVGVSAMAVATMCERLVAGGWIVRQPSATDRRANELRIPVKARKAQEQALAIGDQLTEQVLSGLSAAERRQLLALLGRVREQLLESVRREDARR